MNPKVRWQENDPRTGLTFLPWIQSATNGACPSDGKSNIFVRLAENVPGRCYTYQVIESICVLIQYIEHPETASYSWNYVSGCYENGAFAKYANA
jgi:hypothetical protein